MRLKGLQLTSDLLPGCEPTWSGCSPAFPLASGNNLTDPTGLTVPVAALPQCPPGSLFLAALGCRQQEKQTHSCEFKLTSDHLCQTPVPPFCAHSVFTHHGVITTRRP